MTRPQDATKRARTTKTLNLYCPKVIGGVRVTIEPNGKRTGRFRVTVEPAESGENAATNLDSHERTMNT